MRGVKLVTIRAITNKTDLAALFDLSEKRMTQFQKASKGKFSLNAEPLRHAHVSI